MRMRYFGSMVRPIGVLTSPKELVACPAPSKLQVYVLVGRQIANGVRLLGCDGRVQAGGCRRVLVLKLKVSILPSRACNARQEASSSFTCPVSGASNFSTRCVFQPPMGTHSLLPPATFLVARQENSCAFSSEVLSTRHHG